MPTVKNETAKVQFDDEVIVKASKFKVVDDTDASKVAQFDLSAITVGATSTITIPDTDAAAVLTSGDQTVAGAKTFTGASILHDTCTIADAADPTKKIRFEPGSVTAGQTRVLTSPDYNATLATLAGTETFTNKTLTTPSITNPTVVSGLTHTPSASDALVGVVGTPSSGTLTAAFERTGSFHKITFTLTAARIPVTDGDASGSYGSLKLMDLVEGGVVYLGCRQNYTAYSPDLTGVPDDAAFEIGVGTVDISAAADGTLAAENDDIGADIDQTLSGGTTTGTAHTASSKAFDGTGTAADIYLNWSGSADTIDGSGHIDVTGTISVILVSLGDD